MAKFFVNPADVSGEDIFIKGTDVNHIKNVLRLPIGKEILINDRQGNDYECIIKDISTEMVTAQIIHHLSNHTEPAVESILFQSLVKGEKMEFVIQKSVEIGVTKIIPLVTKRCVVKLESESKLNNKIVRWQKIAESAAKQSKRGIVPEIGRPMEMEVALEYVKTHLDCGCIPYENESSHYIKTYLRSLDVNSIGVFIGPEGGFTEEEVALATEYSVQSITLGRRILRSETAGLVTLANIMYEMGEI